MGQQHASRGHRDPRPVSGIQPGDAADAWRRAALNAEHFGEPDESDRYHTYALLAGGIQARMREDGLVGGGL